MALFQARMGTTLYIYDEGTRDAVVAKLLRMAKRSGKMVYFPHAKVWFEKVPIVDTTKKGSAQYIWAKDGNRVKCHLWKHTIPNNACKEMELLGTCYGELE